MDTHDETFGWGLVRNGALMLKVFGEYPSFHDSAVRTFCMQRIRKSFEDVAGQPLPMGRSRDMVDVRLEVLHNRYGPVRVDGGADYLVTLDFLDIASSEIDVNAMLEEASIMEVSITKEASGFLKFDLVPNIGLDIRLTCKEISISSIRPYSRAEL